MWKKCDFLSIISKKFSAPTILNNFYYCFKVPAETNTIFFDTGKSARGDL